MLFDAVLLLTLFLHRETARSPFTPRAQRRRRLEGGGTALLRFAQAYIYIVYSVRSDAVTCLLSLGSLAFCGLLLLNPSATNALKSTPVEVNRAHEYMRMSTDSDTSKSIKQDPPKTRRQTPPAAGVASPRASSYGFCLLAVHLRRRRVVEHAAGHPRL